ncbi:meiotic nuclear division protein 1 [Coprinopsis sp. MPI-PUGE-AT-0042]|nr:meiotic nuclear division protein 1 [Coprinopsis sp. MPI-PUGE-AT-0042]
MAPRGLSAEEKRVKMLEILHETKDFYQLKELEKLGPKMKGIVSQSVKEVVQSLVDDGLVQMDKIGSSNFFWSFPSQRGAALQAQLQKAQETNEALEAQASELKESIRAENEARPVSEERTELLAKLAALKKQHGKLQDELAAYGNSDPVKVEQLKRAVVLGKEAALRWTDNYCSAFSHFTRLNPVDPDELRRYLEVGDDYEDIY